MAKHEEKDCRNSAAGNGSLLMKENGVIYKWFNMGG